MFDHFYNQSIRKVVIAFGSLFNNVKIKRYDSDGSEIETIRIPLSYGAKEKFISRLNEQTNLPPDPDDKSNIQITLPRMGFEMAGLVYDPTRRGNKLRKRQFKNSNIESTYDYSESPYNISFNLFSFTRSMDDNLQVMEQILPIFTPEFVVSVKFHNPHPSVDIPIVLNSVSPQHTYEGTFQDRRIIMCTYSFMMKSYIYTRARTHGPILDSIIDIFGSYEKFDLSVGATADAQIRATGSLTGAAGPLGYTAGNYVYGPVTYERLE